MMYTFTSRIAVLTFDRTRRIGASKNGAEDIKKHKWYRGLNWAALYNRQESPCSLHSAFAQGRKATHAKH